MSSGSAAKRPTMVILAMGRGGVVEKARRVVRRGARGMGRSMGCMVVVRVDVGCYSGCDRIVAGWDLRWVDSTLMVRVGVGWLGDVNEGFATSFWLRSVLSYTGASPTQE